MNAICCLIFEGSRVSVQSVLDAGLVMLFLNALVAFCLNVSVVFLVGSLFLILTIDRENLVIGVDAIWCAQGYSARRVVRHYLVNSGHGITIFWIHYRFGRINLLQNRR